MEDLFVKLINMSVSGIYIALAIFLLRFILKKAPKKINIVLWAILAVRLVMPFSIESIFSLLPSGEIISHEMLYAQEPEIHSGIDALNSAVNPIISESLAPQAGSSVNPMQIVAFVFTVVWIIGMAAMLIFAVISCLFLKKRLKGAELLAENIYISKNINTPFVFGFIKPKIFLPENVSENDRNNIILHEQMHIKHGDHIIKPFGFLLLMLHWFNPVIWIAYALFCKDIELSCDESVIENMNGEERADYSEVLLSCSVNKKLISACPLAFGEVSVKNRVKSILNYKKPAFWIILISILACIVLALCFLTNPKETIDDKLIPLIDASIAEHHQTEKTSYYYSCGDFEVIGKDTKDNETTVYMWVLYREYKTEKTVVTASHMLTAITFEKVDGNYKMLEYWEPKDGSYYKDSIKEKVPMRLWSKAFDSQKYIDEQDKRLDALAESYFAQGVPAVTDGEQLTLQDVITLSKKGDALSWSDFEKYSYYETGSGLYIRDYKIDDMFSLMIGGGYPAEGSPMYIYLKAEDSTQAVTDIRFNDVEPFIEEHKNNPTVTHLSFSFQFCAVGYSETLEQKMFELNSNLNKTFYLSAMKSLPVVMIDSLEDFDRFLLETKGLLNMDFAYPDSEKMSNAIKLYDEEFFAGGGVLLVCYAVEPTTNARINIEHVWQISDGTLDVRFGESGTESGDTQTEGWLAFISIEDANLNNITDIRTIIG